MKNSKQQGVQSQSAHGKTSNCGGSKTRAKANASVQDSSQPPAAPKSCK